MERRSPAADLLMAKDEESAAAAERRKKGGLITIPFILVNEALEKTGSYGMQANMIMYLTKEYRMSLARGTIVLNWWSFATFFMPLVGAFMADSFLGRFLTILLASLSCFLGTVVLWLTAMIPGWNPSHQESSATAPQLAILVMAFALMSIGAGGVRGSSQALGADQLIHTSRTKTEKERALGSFFNWYYAASCLSVMIGVTVIVYIQDKHGWQLGFALPCLLLLVSILSFIAASSLYIKVKPVRSVLTSFARAILASCKNDSSLCTAEEAKEFKALVRVLPIWSSGIMLAINVNQVTTQVYQANAMDRRVGTFEIPAASMGIFLILAIVAWVTIYDRLVIIPRMGFKLRMGAGLVCTTLAMVTAALVERTRRGKTMCVFWLVPQYVLNGMGEALNAIGQTEFYYSEFPKSMSSIATALPGVGVAFAFLLCNAILSGVNAASRKTGKWVGDDPNKSHYDYYYWFLAGLSFLNLGYYLVCSWAYGPCSNDANRDADSDLQP